MDRPGLDASAHAEALRGLGRINCLSLGASLLWPAIAGLVASHPGRPVRVLDLACGGGDVPIRLARGARRAGLDVRIDGCDISETAVAFARESAHHAGVPVGFFRLDALNEPLPEGYNILMCSLFLHHLCEDEAVRLLRKMAGAARSMILVNDLLRSRIGYGLALVACRLASRSPIVHHDGPVSVGAAFSLAEVRALAARAGLDGARLERRWPRRFLLSWSPESR
jgi:SAM-dependent methyltransferase